MKKFLLICILTVGLIIPTIAQPTITAPTITGSQPGNIVEVPIQVSNFESIVELSLILHFDPTVLEYVEFTSQSPQLLSGNLFMNSVNGNLYVSWYTFEPVTIPDGQIFNLVFNYQGGASPFIWDTVGNMGALTFQNGIVTGPMTGSSSVTDENDNYSVYPNPAGNILNIQLENSFSGNLEIFDINGRIAFRKNIIDQDDMLVVPIQDIESGIYFARIISSEGTLIDVRKFIKE